MNNILFCSAGRRCKLIKDFKETIGDTGITVVAENSIYSPARYVADKSYTVPKITAPDYIDNIIEICRKEDIKVILTLIDPEIEILAQNKARFEEMGILVMCPSEKSAKICFDKYEMYKYLRRNNIPTTLTYGSLEEFEKALNEQKISFPVFVKPRTGSGSVGARKISNIDDLRSAMKEDETLIIQEFMAGIDLDADVYVDMISKKAVSMFSKKKIETRIGGANKTISFKDEKLFELIKKIVNIFEFNGTVDMDFFYKDGQYFLSEINPRFGGAYLHAYGAGVNFPKLIVNNISGIANEENIGNYGDNIMMLMYDDVVIEKLR